jgi:hypothetical protein
MRQVRQQQGNARLAASDSGTARPSRFSGRAFLLKLSLSRLVHSKPEHVPNAWQADEFKNLFLRNTDA